MSAIVISVFGLIVILYSKNKFGNWFNHLAIYAFVWTVMIFLYELKLLKYFPLSDSAWFVILSGATSFIIGVLTIIYWYDNDNKSDFFVDSKKIAIISDNGQTLKQLLYITGMIGLLSALQNWYVLISNFGSIPAIFLSANTVYRARVDSQIEGVIPYFHAFSSIGITLAGFYTAYKNRLTIASSIPIFAAVLKSLAMFGRIGMLIALVQFVSAYFLARQIFKRKDTKVNYKTVVSIIIVFVIIITAASFVKSFRGTYERYKGASSELAYLADNPIFSPSVYLYLSSHIGVLSRYLEEDKETHRLGENTFAAIYNLVAKFGISEKVPYDVPGYYLPMWTNTGTYLRDLHADFGVFGVFFVPYLLGLVTTLFWFKFFLSGKFVYFSILVQLYIVISISFFSFVTRGAEWIFTLVFLIVISPIIERKARIKSGENIE